MKQELEAEKRAVQRLWAKRGKQLDRAMASAVGLHGDLSGIMGSSVPAMEAVRLLALPEAIPDAEESGETRGLSVAP